MALFAYFYDGIKRMPKSVVDFVWSVTEAVALGNTPQNAETHDAQGQVLYQAGRHSGVKRASSAATAFDGFQRLQELSEDEEPGAFLPLDAEHKTSQDENVGYVVLYDRSKMEHQHELAEMPEASMQDDRSIPSTTETNADLRLMLDPAERYYDRHGDIEILQQRLVDLDLEHIDEMVEYGLQLDRQESPPETAEQLIAAYLAEREQIDDELGLAIRDTAELKQECIDQGWEIEEYRDDTDQPLCKDLWPFQPETVEDSVDEGEDPLSEFDDIFKEPDDSGIERVNIARIENVTPPPETAIQTMSNPIMRSWLESAVETPLEIVPEPCLDEDSTDSTMYQ